MLEKIVKWLSKNTAVDNAESKIMAHAGKTSPRQHRSYIYDGEGYSQGLGYVPVFHEDLHSLRQQSRSLFKTNHYARGIPTRLATSIIGAGLHPESTIDTTLVGITKKERGEWTRLVEARYELYGQNPAICDVKKERTMGQLEFQIFLETILGGDCLVILRPDPITKLPSIQTVPADAVVTPWGDVAGNKKIINGVEVDRQGATVAYWVRVGVGEFKRVPAYNSVTGHRTAKLIYGPQGVQMDSMRGVPLLSTLIQSITDLDKFKQATVRKALINSMLVGFVRRTETTPSFDIMGGGAISQETASIATDELPAKEMYINTMVPGTFLQRTAKGEEPVAYGNSTVNETQGAFEQAMVASMAWSLEIPPAVLQLVFDSSFSASMAALSMYRVFLERNWKTIGQQLNFIYKEFLLVETLNQHIPDLGLLKASRDPSMYAEYASWSSCEYYGVAVSSPDPVKQAKASAALLDRGLTTHDREARISTNSKFSRNIERLAEENIMLAEAMRPIIDMRKTLLTAEEDELTVTVDDVLEGEEDDD